MNVSAICLIILERLPSQMPTFRHVYAILKYNLTRTTLRRIQYNSAQKVWGKERDRMLVWIFLPASCELIVTGWKTILYRIPKDKQTCWPEASKSFSF
jgi:hypothetical protein